jgi:hypothetical protein
MKDLSLKLKHTHGGRKKRFDYVKMPNYCLHGKLWKLKCCNYSRQLQSTSDTSSDFDTFNFSIGEKEHESDYVTSYIIQQLAAVSNKFPVRLQWQQQCCNLNSVSNLTQMFQLRQVAHTKSGNRNLSHL